MSQPPEAIASRHPRFSETNFVWVDMEMTGLNPDSDRVIEIAVVVTDAELDVIAEGPVLALHQQESILLGMDSWNTATHGRSGLTERVRVSTLDEENATDQLLAFLAPLVPRLEAFFHYRNVDVSTLKELARRWQPEVHRSFEKKSRHEALADIYESIDELKHYRTHFLRA
jgi:oligoribonuclease